ncbi:MAG: glucosaminidase domain-containing protein [Lewinellaceae bacterium]|nr:glucosaminidase domain-containing protein [Lewinellaceae bacterium]
MRTSRYTPAPAPNKGVRPERPRFNLDEISLLDILEKLLAGLKRVLVALHYRLLHFRPGGRGLPWFKIALAALLVWMALKRDMQFQINLKKPGAETTVLNGFIPEDSPKQLVSQPAPAAPKKGLGAELLGPRDPFADATGDTDEDRRNKNYIRRFKEVAQTEMEKFGIPASVKMAQALIESQAGTSKLATKNNNHFGIKCFSKSCKKGHCSNFSDDHHKDFFRIYSSAWESWRSHSYLVTQGKYKKLLSYGKDYKAWAHGLKELGYATDPHYDKKIIEYIDRYDLQVLDK